jgi:flagellar biosynthetic protein FliR
MTEPLALIPDLPKLMTGALAFLRIGGIIFTLPVIGDSPTPVRTRSLMALALTIGLFPVIPAGWMPSLQLDVLVVAGCVVRELAIGLFIGFAARVLFDGVLMASSVVAYQMGFGTASLFLPDANANMDSFTAFHRMLIMLIFLTLGLHHIFLGAIVETFRLIPGGGATMNGQLGVMMIELTAGIFAIALQLAAPILVAMMFTMAALGLVARTVPQMNVFTLSFPVSFFIGIMVYVATLPFFPAWMLDHFSTGQEQLSAVIRGLR